MLYLKKNRKIKKNFLLELLPKIDIKFLVTLICFAFLGNSIYENFDSLSNQTINIQKILWLFVGIIFSFSSIIINAYAWKLLIKNIGCEVNNLNIIKLFLSTNIYKYLPGGIWHFVSRYNTLRLEISTEKSIESILIEPLLMLVAGFLYIPLGKINIILFIVCWSTTLIFLPVFRQFLIMKLKAFKATIFTKKDLLISNEKLENTRYISKKISYPFKPLLVETLFIFIRFLGFFCCMNAFSIGASISKAEIISSFSLAWIIGLIVPAAPGGLGVFESVILFRLGPHFPEASLLATLLCYRLVSTISDICAAFIYPVKKYLRFI